MFSFLILLYLVLGVVSCRICVKYAFYCNTKSILSPVQKVFHVLGWPSHFARLLRILKNEQLFCKFIAKIWFMFKV